MNRYAGNTTVSVESSQREVQSILRKYGADRFGVMEDRDKAHLMFSIRGLAIQITISLPSKGDFELTEKGRSRKKSQSDAAYEQAIRQRWRSLVLMVKAKLVGIEDGITTIEKEFLAFIVLPEGITLGDKIIPQIEQVAASGKMPSLLTYTK